MESPGVDTIACHLCRQTYKTPKYLQCLHTFCETCLGKWIVSKVTKGTNKSSFKCPVCDIDTDPPLGWTFSNIIQWASLYPDDRLVQSCIDQDQIRKGLRKCDLCMVRYSSRNAEYWCRQCSEAYCEACKPAHGSMKKTKRHEVLPMHQISKDLSLVTQHEICTKHPDEEIRLFCADHNASCCAVCSIVMHRRCVNVVDIHDAAKLVRTKRDYMDNEKHLRKAAKELQETEDVINENIAEVTQKRLRLEKAAESFVNRLCERMKSLLNDHKTKLNNIHGKALTGLNAAKEVNIGEQRFLENVLNHLDQTSISDEQIFLHMKKATTKHRELTAMKKQVPVKTWRHNIKPNTKALMDACLSIESICDVSLTEGTRSETELAPIQHPISWTIEQVKRWFVESRVYAAVQNTAYYHSDNCIVTVCSDDRKMCSYNAIGRQTSAVELTHEPYAATILGSEIMVTLPKAKHVAVFELTLDELIGSRKEGFELQKACYGITAISQEDNVVVVCGHSLKVMDAIMGIKCDEIPLDDANYRNVTSDSTGRVYVTNPFIHRVLCVDLKSGHTLFEFTDYPKLKFPNGVALDPLGNVYVVGCLSKNIVKLTKDGKFKDTILTLSDGLYHPNYVAFKKGSYDFLVTNDIDVFLYTVK
ncbi:E3 ubiquitin-protein ligase Midline-1-like [Mizuhopecten yessoensis]|uniref:Tripartite motif-containing protein 45 n=1 Tax=Mizuhopecten yessoensis TaxID=6573 RepID=A0A210QP90_MIZYE|nr:E3 ubiquitin-protein ligase Midline-1-like [Mizuhopecten yessoensis]XP_021353444.1 E3 ubiquitin-protein ligase Midline-1-like [Mizuhopecten yessoensis]OWF50518.1 Tripartite motif-containing protein 45 [Mizuhopecten yessoensis]